MSAPKLGSLHASISVDELARPRYGATDKITGTITLSYKPASSLFSRNTPTADLFGPLKITVNLHGKIRIKVRRDRSHHVPTSHGINLFQHPFPVYNGTLKAEVGNEFKYPFEASFPEDLASPYPEPRIGLYATLMSSGQSSTQLPPTLAQHFSDYPDVVDLAVIYRLGVSVNVPGIDVKTTIPEGHDRPLVLYDLPRPPRSLMADSVRTFNLSSRLQNEYLLPEDQRPEGFKQKAKAVFSSSQFPELVMNITCTDYRHLYPGQRPKFTIVLRRNDKESTAPLPPETTLESFKAELTAFTAVDVHERFLGSSQCSDRTWVQVWASPKSLPQDFAKANDHSITVTIGPVLKHHSSFLHHKLSLQYLLRISIQLKVARKSIKLNRECPVVMVPPPAGVSNTEWVPAPPPEPGPFQPRLEEEEQLPAYGEAGSSTLLKSA